MLLLLLLTLLKADVVAVGGDAVTDAVVVTVALVC